LKQPDFKKRQSACLHRTNQHKSQNLVAGERSFKLKQPDYKKLNDIHPWTGLDLSVDLSHAGAMIFLEVGLLPIYKHTAGKFQGFSRSPYAFTSAPWPGSSVAP